MSDGSGLTARQCATVLAEAGHEVEVLSPDPLCLCRFTRHVRRVNRVPAYGTDPAGWLDAALARYAAGRFDVLLPTQEQVAVLSRMTRRLDDAGVVTAVPPFDALMSVQDKLSAFATLTRLGLPQPPATMITSRQQLAAWTAFPVYLKTPIGTATTGVVHLTGTGELAKLDASWPAAAHDGGLLAQQPVSGPLVMVQSVFAHGHLLALHANTRLREGARGGASHKRGVHLPEVRTHLGRLGAELRWHGALSADVVLTDDGPMFIDINPRLVEPVNALRSGVDLVAALLDVALNAPTRTWPDTTPGVRTHQLLLAVLGAAQHHRTRRAVIGELLAAARHRDDYRDSTEELTPLRHDRRTAAVVAVASAATIIRPRTWTWFAAGSVSGYALTPQSWRHILDLHP